MDTLRALRCSRCNKLILRCSKDGMWRLSSRVLKIENIDAPIIAVCKDCGSEELLPLRLEIAMPTNESQHGLVIHVKK